MASVIAKVEAFLANNPKILSLVRLAVYGTFASLAVEAGIADELLAALEAATEPVA